MYTDTYIRTLQKYTMMITIVHTCTGDTEIPGCMENAHSTPQYSMWMGNFQVAKIIRAMQM